MNQKVVLFVAVVMMSILPLFAQSKKIYLENLSQEEIDKCLDSQRYNVFELLDMGETVRYKRRNPYVLETNDGLRYSIDKNQAVVVDCSPDWKGGTIPSSVEYGGKTYPVQSIGASAFRLKRSVEEIVISEGVTRIEEYAFANMPSLRKVVFPNSLDSIEGGAFYGAQEIVCDFDLDYLHSVNDIYDNPHVILYYIIFPNRRI